MNNNKEWLAAYLYYAEPWEKLIIEAVKPFAESIIDQQLADQFFFIRYWEKGPHIRLRFKGDRQILQQIVKPKLINYFETYFKDNPSERKTPEWLEDATEEQKWYPNNSIQFIEYEPETERYGGEHAILVAETQFQASSEAALGVIGESLDAWNYERALGAAIQLHLGFGYALGMDLHQLHGFFSSVFRNWLPMAYYYHEKDISKKELEKRKAETLKTFDKNFQQQKDTLIPFFETIWKALREGQEFEQDWLNQWIIDMKNVGDKLLALQKRKQLIVSAWVKKVNEGFPVEYRERWAIYDSYVHMMNNRLGIMNRDEGYLGYLIVESIREMRNGIERRVIQLS